MKAIAVKVLRWLTIVVALVLSADALLSIYKTIVFRDGIDSRFDLLAVLLVCFVLLAVTALTGLGALAGTLKRDLLLSARVILSIAVGVGLLFLSTNVLPLSEWVRMALVSKSESVAVCVALCGMLVCLTWEEAAQEGRR